MAAVWVSRHCLRRFLYIEVGIVHRNLLSRREGLLIAALHLAHVLGRALGIRTTTRLARNYLPVIDATLHAAAAWLVLCDRSVAHVSLTFVCHWSILSRVVYGG